MLECNIGTVKSRILRGRRALKEILEPLLSERVAHAGAGTENSAIYFEGGLEEQHQERPAFAIWRRLLRGVENQPRLRGQLWHCRLRPRRGGSR